MADSELVTKKDLENALAQMRMLIREVQNVLLEQFLAQAKPQSMRMNGHDAADLAVRQRLQVIEERLLNLETRPFIRPN